jgi:luciferase family oxidoreductase group 1
MANFQIGLLDFGRRDKNTNSLLAVSDVLDYAMRAEALGYNRFWLAEHHNPDVKQAWADPSILLPLIAGYTKNIKVGAAGILMGVHNPYEVAANYKLLANLFYNRIDLGFANGGINKAISKIMADGISMKEIRNRFTENVQTVIDYFDKEAHADDDPENMVIIPPYKGVKPHLWSLGGSNRGLKLALDLRTNFSRSLFHAGVDLSFDKYLLEEYNEQFEQRYKTQPETTICIGGYCHTDAKNLAAMKVLYKDSPDHMFIGSPAEMQDHMETLIINYGYKDIIFYNIALEPTDRSEVIACISELFKLSAHESGIYN